MISGEKQQLPDYSTVASLAGNTYICTCIEPYSHVLQLDSMTDSSLLSSRKTWVTAHLYTFHRKDPGSGAARVTWMTQLVESSLITLVAMLHTLTQTCEPNQTTTKAFNVTMQCFSYLHAVCVPLVLFEGN